MWGHNYYVYINSSTDKSVLYIGVTNDLCRRIGEHTENKGNKNTFSGKYYCYYLVYYEHFTHIDQAIAREKELKKWRREKKDVLIKSTNPEWRFLNDEIMDE